MQCEEILLIFGRLYTDHPFMVQSDKNKKLTVKHIERNEQYFQYSETMENFQYGISSEDQNILDTFPILNCFHFEHCS